jgi:hypothetical protein
MGLSLITSASYAADELVAEFGRLPPAFLPVGHRRLYEAQIDLLGAPIYLTLPASFRVPDADRQQLDDAGVTVVAVPDGLRLGESVHYALEMIGHVDGAVRILHGDTMIYDLPPGDDVVAVGEAPDAYSWGAADEDRSEGEEHSVLAGYFAFADGLLLRRSLAVAQGDFVTGVHEYGHHRPLAQIPVNAWLDCGHLQTYYRSRCSIRTQRAFNELAMTYQQVEKRSSDHAKMAAEAAWYEDLPARLRLYTPAFLGRSHDAPGYAIEYVPSPSLHELLVFGELGEAGWRNILHACFVFMHACRTVGAPAGMESPLGALTGDKTTERLDRYLHSQAIPAGTEWRYRGRTLPSLHRIAELASEAIDMERRDMLGVMHGDLCFTNTFYDFRTRRIRAIDPRGGVDGKPGIYGDLRYDLAKLNHSVLGLYDFVLTGRFRCTGFAERDLMLEFPGDARLERIAAVAREFDVGGCRLGDRETTAITIHLFLSMLPLHSEAPSRQQAFLANALRMFAEGFEQ